MVGRNTGSGVSIILLQQFCNSDLLFFFYSNENNKKEVCIQVSECAHSVSENIVELEKLAIRERVVYPLYVVSCVPHVTTAWTLGYHTH